MKTLFITTETNEIPKYADSLRSLPGNEVEVCIFQHRTPHNEKPTVPDISIYRTVIKSKPDMIVYVGACGGNMPSVECLTWLRRNVAPSVLICSDAADGDSPWWPLLDIYAEKNTFSVMVAIDGNRDWPYHNMGLTLLTPIDPATFAKGTTPHAQRDIKFGFAGNIGGNSPDKTGVVRGRRPYIDQMTRTAGLQFRNRDRHGQLGTYQDVADFMCRSCITPNFPETGSFRLMHVKGRVVEAGLAGCMLLEGKRLKSSSPTEHWFEKGVDYLEWDTLDDVRRILKETTPEISQQFGERLRAKVLAEHTPEKFWGKIFKKIEDVRP